MKNYNDVFDLNEVKEITRSEKVLDFFQTLNNLLRGLTPQEQLTYIKYLQKSLKRRALEMRKFYSIKYENIFASLYAPYIIINTSKADVDMILLALLSHIITLLGIYYTIRVSRREALQELKNGTYESFILEDILIILKNTNNAIKGLKIRFKNIVNLLVQKEAI